MVLGAIARQLGAVIIDVNDVERISAFWGALLGQEPGQLRNGGDWLTVGTLADNARWSFSECPKPKRSRIGPTWTFPLMTWTKRSLTQAR